MKNHDTANQQTAYGIDDIINTANVGRSTVYREIREGRLRARKVGRRTIVLVEDYRAWLNSLPPHADTPKGAD